MPAVVGAAIVAALPGISIAAAEVIGSIVVTAISYGVGEYIRSQNTRPRDIARSAFGDDGRKQAVRQPVPMRRAVYGNVLASGPMFFYHVDRPWLYIGTLLSQGPISGVESVQIAGRTVRFNPVSFEAIEEPYQTASAIYAYASFRAGRPDQTIDPLLAADFPALPATFRQQGIATAVFKLHWGASADHHNELWGSRPNPLCRVVGRLVYDPRRTGQSPTDWTTWTYSNNAALVLAHWLISRWRLPVDPAQVDWVRIAEAADICDQWATRLAAAPERRFAADGVVMGDDPHYETARQLLSAINGTLSFDAGLYSVRTGTARDPVLTITDRDVVGAIKLRHDAPVAEAPTEVRTVFVSSDRQYERANGPVLAPAAYAAADGRINSMTLDLPYTSSHTTAQRLGQVALRERRMGRILTTTLHPATIGLELGDVVRVALRTLPYLDGLYSVEQRGLAASGVPVQLRAYDAANYAFDPTTDEQPFTIAPADLT